MVLVIRNQHIFPKVLIKRFADHTGNVIVNTPWGTYPKKAINKELFTAEYRWEVESEIFQGTIERPFQDLVPKLIKDNTYILSSSDQITVSKFFALWRARSFAMNINPLPIRIFPSHENFEDSDSQPSYIHEPTKSIYPMKIENGVISSQNRTSFSLHATFINYVRAFINGAKWKLIVAEIDNLFAIPKNADIGVAYIPLTPELALHSNQELESEDEKEYSIKLSQQSRTSAEFITRP